MDNHQDETTTFEVTVTSDGVSTSGISGSPQIVLDTNNTLSWGINECSSSFQSVSSCETLESYEHNALNTSESPQVIVVPFLADNEITGNVLVDNGVHIPVIKECSIRIDQLKMSSSAHCDELNVERIIELPFSTNCSTDCSPKTQPGFLTDDDSSAFEGFGLESIIGTQYEMYKTAVSLMNRNDGHTENVTGPSANEPISTERHLTEIHHPVRHPPERIIKPETVKRPRQIQRKISKPQPSDNQSDPINQSRIESPEITVPTSKQNNIVKPVPIPDRISSTPAESVDVKSNRPESSSDSSDSDSDVAPAAVDNSATKKKVDRSADIKNKNKQKELRKLEKMRRRKELSLVAERIRDHWRETFAAAKRKQRKKAKKSKMESNKYKTHHSKNDSPQNRAHRKRKRISCSSDSDSSDSSDTSCSSSSDSETDSNDSDSTRASDTSYTSQTSHTRTESSTDSDSSDVHYRYRHRLNRCKRSPSATSDTSETSSSEDTFDKRRRFHLLKKAIYRKQSKTKSHDNCPKPRKRKSSESYRCDEPLQKKKKVTKNLDRAHSNDAKQTKNRTIFSQKQQRFDAPSRSSSAKVRKIKSEFAKRSEIETTSAGDFSVRQCCFD